MSTDSGAPRSAAPIHRTPPAAPPRAAVGPPGARSSSRASVSTQSGSRPGSSAGAAPYAHPRHGGAFNEGDECMEEEDPTARVTFEPEGGDQEAERGGRVGHPISAKASIRGAAHAAQATAPAAPPAATAEELLAEDLQQRLAAMFLARQGRAPLPSGSGSSIPSPAGGLRVVGLSFIGLLGLDPGLCWMEVCIARPRTRPASAPARLHATFPGPCRSYPPPPQPWPPSGVHFHRSDPPFGRSCIVSALSVCPVCSSRAAHRATDLAIRAAARAAGAARAMAAAWAAAEAAAWPSGWPVAAARAPLQASPAAFSCRSRAAAEAAAEAAAGSRRRIWRPGRRLRRVRSWGAAGTARRRRGAASRGFSAIAPVHASFHRKKLGPSYVGLHVCAHVCAMCGERQRVIHDALITLVCVASFGC